MSDDPGMEQNVADKAPKHGTAGAAMAGCEAVWIYRFLGNVTMQDELTVKLQYTRNTYRKS